VASGRPVRSNSAVGAGARQQHQGVDEQGLAGASLAADHGEPWPEGNLGFFDDGELTDVERGEHGYRWRRMESRRL
jgi:hypothetical protein